MKISAFSTDSRAGADHTRGQGVGPWIKQGRGLRGIQVAVLVALMATACVPHRAGEMSPAHGLGLGLGYLIASPLLILSGLLEGIVTAPYLLNADLHEMKVLATDIQTHERNYTRFVVLGPRSQDALQTKTTLVCTLDHTGASLPDLIAAFASRQIPLYKIESRKLEDDPWAYRFYVECRGDAQDASVAQALQEIQLIVRDFNLVGSYPAAPLLP